MICITQCYFYIDLCSLCFRASDRRIGKAICSEFVFECEFWDDSAAILASIGSIKIVNPSNENVILMDKKVKFPFFSV